MDLSPNIDRRDVQRDEQYVVLGSVNISSYLICVQLVGHQFPYDLYAIPDHSTEYFCFPQLPTTLHREA